MSSHQRVGLGHLVDADDAHTDGRLFLDLWAARGGNATFIYRAGLRKADYADASGLECLVGYLWGLRRLLL